MLFLQPIKHGLHFSWDRNSTKLGSEGNFVEEVETVISPRTWRLWLIERIKAAIPWSFNQNLLPPGSLTSMAHCRSCYSIRCGTIRLLCCLSRKKTTRPSHFSCNTRVQMSVTSRSKTGSPCQLTHTKSRRTNSAYPADSGQ